MALTINHQTNDISATSGSMTIDGSSVGGSTTAGAVGTYAVGRPANGTTYAVGDTVSGIRAPRTTRSYWSNSGSTFYEPTYAGYTLSGTWRTMTPVHGGGIGLWLRIS